MSTQYIPNSFQTPNAVIDELMGLLTDSELRVLMYTIRHILGWQKKIAKRRAAISISLFVNGFGYQDEEGKTHRFNGCGMKEGAVRQALQSLEAYGILKAVGAISQDGREWELAFMTTDKVDLAGLRKRQSEKATKDKKQLSSARSLNPKITPSVQQEGFCPTEGEGFCPTEGEGFCPTGDNETHEETHEETHLPEIENPELEAMKLAVKKLLKQYKPSSCENIAKSLLSLHRGKKAFTNLAIPITVEDLPLFCVWWDKKKDKNGQSLTRPRNTDSVLPAVADWQETTDFKAKSTPKPEKRWDITQIPDMKSEAEHRSEDAAREAEIRAAEGEGK